MEEVFNYETLIALWSSIAGIVNFALFFGKIVYDTIKNRKISKMLELSKKTAQDFFARGESSVQSVDSAITFFKQELNEYKSEMAKIVFENKQREKEFIEELNKLHSDYAELKKQIEYYKKHFKEIGDKIE